MSMGVGWSLGDVFSCSLTDSLSLLVMKQAAFSNHCSHSPDALSKNMGQKEVLTEPSETVGPNEYFHLYTVHSGISAIAMPSS